MIWFAVNIQHALTQPLINSTGNREWVISLNATPKPSTLVELYWIKDRLVMYREARFAHARGRSTGMPELRKSVMKRIMRKVEYSLYGLNWNEAI